MAAMAAIHYLIDITGYHDQNFYNTIFNLHNQNDQRLDKLNNILDINENFKNHIVLSNSNDFASAAADFARLKVLESNELNDYINCKNFRDFFEFVITEFEDIVYEINSQDDYQDNLLNRYFDNGPLLVNNTRQITQTAYIGIDNIYNQRVADYVDAVDRLRNTNQVQLGNMAIYDEIQRMAESNKLRFDSTPSGVCHWRKHRFMYDMLELNAISYLIDANETVNHGYLMEYPAFEFRYDFNIESFRLATVHQNRPNELITYHIRKRNMYSDSYRQGIIQNNYFLP
jgi:hypothetical protein